MEAIYGRREQEIKRKNLAYGAALIFFTLVFVCSIFVLLSMHVSSQTKSRALFDNSRYEQAEQDFKEQVLAVLASYGCYHSGINLTRVVSMDGAREYTLSINDRRFSLLGDDELEMLREELSLLQLSDSGVQSSGRNQYSDERQGGGRNQYSDEGQNGDDETDAAETMESAQEIMVEIVLTDL
jgi:hypothetical protein